MLRPAVEEDLPAMRAWRNQPVNREASLTSHVISPEEHLAWWDRVRQDPTREVLVFESAGRPLGVVNFFDIDPPGAGPRSAMWGFYLDSDTTSAEGTAMTAWMQVMRQAVGHAFEAPPEGLGLDVLRGEVLEHNEAVRQMNRRYRFTEGTPEQREVDGRTVTVIPISLRREDRRGAGRQASRGAGSSDGSDA